jgi:hypothetical protein
MTILRIPPEERFWRRVVRQDGCWLWSGSSRYGRFRLGGKLDKMISPHRFSYELANGPVPAGLFVCHRCDNPRCVNPGHLFAGTAGDNIRDCVEKGRARGTFKKGFDPRRLIGAKSPHAKLTDQQAISIRADSRPNKYIAADYGVSPSLVGRIKRREIWTHV